MEIPLIDLKYNNLNEIAKQIRLACRKTGFFYISNHGISVLLQDQLEQISEIFFDLPLEDKMEIEMKLGGKAWRGYFPVKGELTSGKPDLKEGVYFGQELDLDNKYVQSDIPMHGKNLFPTHLPKMKEIVLAYIDQVTKLGHRIMELISLSLELPNDYFKEHFTSDPLILFRLFHYPPTVGKNKDNSLWGVGEHTDYGLFTILKQDKVGGLQVKSNDNWIDAPYIDNTFICNIGDMLEKLTNGYYISTPHRVLNTSGKERYSFPLFFDPNFDANLKPIDLTHLNHTNSLSNKRWDRTNLSAVQGTYGEYILNKVSKVFPELGK